MTPNNLASDELMLCVLEENQQQKRKNNCKKSQYKIGTWNVRGMNELGKTENIVNEMKNMDIDILGISETFLKNSGDYVSTLPNNDKFRVIYSGGTKSRKGVGFILNQRTMNTVETIHRESERVIAIKIKAQPVDLFIIEAYAPTSDAAEEEVDEFYESVKNVINKKKSRDILLLIGDFNSKVGKQRRGDTMGPYGTGKINDRGENFINFCIENDLVITNTWFEQKETARYTWTAPGGRLRNKIDYVCINKRYRNTITNSKSRPGADCGSDHVPVVANLQVRLKKVDRKNTKTRWDLQKCKNQDTKEKFTTTFIKEVENNANQSDLWTNCRDALKRAAETSIGKSRPTAKQKWMSQDILDQMEVRKELKRVSTIDSTRLEEYNFMKRKIQAMCRKAKEDFLNKECEEAERLEKINTNKFHNKIKSLTKTESKISDVLVDENGVELDEDCQILERWKRYCETLYDDSERPVLNPTIVREEDIPKFTELEIQNVIKGLNNNKATGPDEIPAEFLKTLKEHGITYITNLINDIYKTGIIPEDFVESTFIPLPKKNKAKNCCDFLISHSSKVLLALIRERIAHTIERNLTDTQMGFRQGKGCRDGITALRVILENSMEVNKNVFLAFVDFEKAFDNIKHQQLKEILEEINTPKAELRLIENMYWNQKGRVQTKHGKSEPFLVKKGVRQGCIISPALFNIYVEKIIEEAIGNEKDGFKINGSVTNNLRYADDTLIIANSERELEVLLKKLDRSCKNYGMKINLKKTKIMTVSKAENPQLNTSITLGTETLEDVQKYPYLGAEITNDARCLTEIKKRIGIELEAQRDSQKKHQYEDQTTDNQYLCKFHPHVRL
uniref:Craniofacial development protein 2 n=1 Tax=Cacopsylla melanoneura TaxID=428564 RepID=A0A8D8YDR6_9HEMI